MRGVSVGELLERYEATGDEAAFVEATRLYEQALAEAPDPLLFATTATCSNATAAARSGEPSSSTSAPSSWTRTPTSPATS
jgi:hypothetical protein